MNKFPGLTTFALRGAVAALTLSLLHGTSLSASAEPTGLTAIKSYLVGKVTNMDKASHDFAANAAAYEKIVKANGGDYNQAVIKEGDELLGLIMKMQGDYRVIHNTGYETIEGIVAGVKPLVDFDTYLDAGVPKAEASTDSPASPLVLKSADGKTIIDRGGNLFHYVMEPALWGTKQVFVHPLSAEAQARAKGIKVLPRTEVLSAASQECARKMDELLAASQRWQPTMDECVGALVWMTPTLNGYFEDWKDSRYNPNAAMGRYVAESRVVDMRGIKSQDREARKYYGGPETTQITSALALLSGSRVSTLIANFFLAVTKMSIPTKLFTDEVEAVNWLKGFLQ